MPHEHERATEHPRTIAATSRHTAPAEQAEASRMTYAGLLIVALLAVGLSGLVRTRPRTSRVHLRIGRPPTT